MTTSARPQLRLIRGVLDEIREAESDLMLIEKYFATAAQMGPRTLSVEQLNNFAQIARRSRMVCAAVRGDQ